MIAKAFDYQESRLKKLRGVFFLGAALPRGYEINKGMILPKGMKITNYYSEHYDRVLPLFYNNQGVKAGGQVGFDDIKLFDNLRTTCTHSHKGIGIHRDYSTLAEAIGYLMMWQEQRYIEGKQFKAKRKMVMRGLLSWHDIYQIKDARLGDKFHGVLIQQRWNTRNYRIVTEDAFGKPYQLAKGRSLHAMLNELGLFNTQIGEPQFPQASR